ncbi:MAG: lasso peptide biosynthesis B2 protein [Bacteroidales bacterium]|nr:lasso peptide biosynthesis B2 protein [Bacteroidales bacterium]
MCIIHKLRKISKQEFLIFLETYITSIIVRFKLMIFSFKYIQKKLKNNSNSTNHSNANENELIELIKLSLKRTKKYTPFRFYCIEQSLTAAAMLKRRKIPFTLYVGIYKNKQQFETHVWLITNNNYIVEKGNYTFSIIQEIHG